MAEFIPPLIVNVEAKVAGAIASLGKVNAELSKMEVKLTGADLAMAKMSRASKLAGVAIEGIAASFGIMAVASVKHLMTVQEAQTRLEVAISKTGNNFEAIKPYIDTANKSMEGLGFTTAQTYDALAKMTAASGSPRLALESLAATADLARAKQMDLADAGTLVARASIGQAKGLGDLGIALGKTLPKGATFAQVLKAIEDRYGGLAQKSKKDLAVQLDVLKAKFGELEVKLGTALLPTFESIANWIISTGLPDLEKLGKWFSDNKGTVEAFGTALAGIWAVSKITTAVTAIISVIKTLIATYNALKIAAGLAFIAEAAATGGASLAPAALATTAAGLAVAGLWGFSKLAEQQGGTGTAIAPTAITGVSMGRQYGTYASLSSLKSRSVPRYDSKTTKPAKTSIASQQRGSTLNINIKTDHSRATIDSIKNGNTK